MHVKLFIILCTLYKTLQIGAFYVSSPPSPPSPPSYSSTTTELYSFHENSKEVNHFMSQSRRSMFQLIGAGVVSSCIATKTTTQSANALDMDAFINKELDVDKSKTEISDDVKTCRYAAPGKEKGDACVRAGISVAGKNGGVDAYGRIDRGDFVRCKTSYPMIDGKYVKTVTCE